MKPRKLLSVSLVGTALFLFGCSGTIPTDMPVVHPLLAVRNGGVDADGMYRIGRYYQEQSRHAQAEKAFLDSLKMDPRHAEARNALGVTYFVQGRHAQAEEQFRLAIAAAPDEAHLRKNLSRLYALTGRQPEPVADVSIAATVVAAKAVASGEPARPAAAVTPPADRGDAQPAARLVPVAPNVWELNPSPAESATAGPAPAAAAPLAQRVEVSNGNGVTGLAGRVGRHLQANGYRKPRLTNQPGFGIRQTEVRYVAGSEGQAQALVAVLQAPARLVPAKKLERNAGVQVVLGRDFRESPAIAAGGGPVLVAEERSTPAQARE